MNKFITPEEMASHVIAAAKKTVADMTTEEARSLQQEMIRGAGAGAIGITGSISVALRSAIRERFGVDEMTVTS